MAPLCRCARAIGATMGLCVLAGCASITSSYAPPPKGERGLLYYMPLNPIVLTLTVDADGNRTVDVTALPAVADTSAPYVLRHSVSQAASQSSDIKVGTNGLLQGDSTGHTTSSMESIAQAMGKALGAQRGPGMPVAGSPTNLCTAAGTYTWRLYPNQDSGFSECQIQVDARLLNHENRRLDGDVKCPDTKIAPKCADHYEPKSTRAFGVYYRQRLPVQITVTATTLGLPSTPNQNDGQGDPAELTRYFVVSAATKHSPVSFLPIPRSLFADTKWQLSFDAGSPTVYKIESAGEIEGVLTFPAALIAAYSEAITAGFTRSKEENAAQAEALQQMQALAVSQAQAANCRAVAAGSNDLAEIRAACALKD